MDQSSADQQGASSCYLWASRSSKPLLHLPGLLQVGDLGSKTLLLLSPSVCAPVCSLLVLFGGDNQLLLALVHVIYVNRKLFPLTTMANVCIY